MLAFDSLGDFNFNLEPNTNPNPNPLPLEDVTKEVTPEEGKKEEKKEEISTKQDTSEFDLDFGEVFKEEEGEEEEGKDTEQKPDLGANVQVEVLTEAINSVAELFGGELEPHEDYDESEPVTVDLLKKLIDHNLNIQREKTVEDFVSNLSPKVKGLIEFDLSINEGDPDTDAKILSYIQSLTTQMDIKNLNVENEYDQESIVKKWYEREGWSDEEIAEKVKDLKDTSLLKKEATRVKPKLEQKANEEIAKKEKEERSRLDQEKQLDSNYWTKVQTAIKDGKINDIKLSREEMEQILRYMGTEKRSYNTPIGKAVTPPLEAIINYYRYAPNADVNVLAEAVLLLTNPTLYRAKKTQVIKAEETKKFINEHKQNNLSLSGVGKPEKKPEPTKGNSLKIGSR
jgi:hypothetical protein